MSKMNKLLSGFLAMVFVLTSFGSLAVSADETADATAEVIAEENVAEDTAAEEVEESKPIIYDGTYNVKGFDFGEYDDAKHSDGGYDAGYDPDYDYTTDWQEVKYFIDENFCYNNPIYHQGERFMAPSGWDARNLGGSFTEKYFFHQGLIDTSEKFPVELNRKFENANHGRITLDFIYVPLEKAQDGITFTLGQGGLPAIKYITREDGLYLQQTNGDDIFIGKYNVRPTDQNEVSWGTEETVFNNGIRTIFNMDNNTIEKIFCDGILVKENVPFTNNVDYVDNFNINTGDKNTGKLWMRGVKMHRGYLMHDQFISSKLNVPTDYNASGNVSMMNMQSGTPWDYTNMVLETGAQITKYVDKVQGKQMVYETCFYLPEKADGYQIRLKGNEKDTIKLTVHDNKFWYSTNGEEKEIYSDYFPGVWYKFRAYMDLETKKATLYINGIKRAEDVDLYNDTIDAMEAINSGAKVYLDFCRLWYDTPEPEDYCPEPQPVTPKDPEMLVGMQFCPMWRNGYHVCWDLLNMDKRRVPYLGYYDEGDPEVNDWMIKQLVEHGFNFQRVTIIADTPGPYENPTFGWSFIDEGLKYAKYKSMLPYCVLMETGSVYHPSREWFLNHYLTYMIEHYFKDPDYLKIDGRPVLTCWTSANFFKYAGTAEDAKTPIEDKIPLCQEFLKEIRQKCIDAGVGNPIIAMNLGADEQTLKLYKEIGIDASMPYSSSSTVEGQISDQDKTLAYKDILDKTIAFSPGMDGSLGGSVPGNQVIEAEDYQKIVDHYLEIRDQFDEGSLARRFVCLDTYDEYGEGHWVGPSGGEGWGYFDAIYEGFCEKDSHAEDHAHAHQVPTTEQKDRFNNCYPPNRRIQTVDIVRNASTGEMENTKVVKAFNFDTDGDTEGWSGSQVSGLTVKNGCLTGKVTGNDSQLYGPQMNLDYHGLVQIRIRLKYNVKPENRVTSNQVFFVTHNGQGFSQGRSFRRGGEWSKESGDDGFFDLIYPIAGTNLVDNFKQLRFDVIEGAPVSMEDSEFMIDSIEFLYREDFDTTEEEIAEFNSAPAYMTIDDEVQTLNAAPIKEGDKWYYPLRQIAVNLGGKVDYDWLNDRTTVLFGDSWAQIDNANKKATVNGGTLRANPVIVERDGTSYITDRFFEMLFETTLTYDETTRMVGYNAGQANSNKKREEIYASEFDVDGDTENWYNYQNVGQLSASNGYLTGKITSKDPMLAKSGLSIKAADVKNIQIKMKNNTDDETVKFYFETVESPGLSESKAFSCKVKNDGTERVVDIDPAVCKAWAGTVKFIRMDPGSKATYGTFAYDYIRFEGDWKTIEGAPSITQNEYELTWNFDANSAKDGWLFSKQFGDCKVEDGILSASVIGPSPKLYTIADLGVDSSKISEIEVKFKNASDGTKAKLMFLMDKQAEFEKGPSVEFDINANDPESTSYIIPVSDIEGFDGTLNSICFMPTNGNGSVEIDYFTLVYAQE